MTSYDRPRLIFNIGLPKNWIAADIVRLADGVLAKHWDMLQDEATGAESRSGLPMFGEKFSE
jgi:predicted SnoaL-like aldol condensation-catalyzing enzyme